MTLPEPIGIDVDGSKTIQCLKYFPKVLYSVFYLIQISVAFDTQMRRIKDHHSTYPSVRDLLGSNVNLSFEFNVTLHTSYFWSSCVVESLVMIGYYPDARV